MMGFVMAAVIVVLIVGSLALHFVSMMDGVDLYFTDIATNWSLIDLTVDITFWVTGIVFVAVNGFMVWCLYKFRHRPGHKADYDPENTKLEVILTAVTAVGVAAMLAPGLFAWGEFVTVPENARQIEAMGKQWHWSYRMPGADGVLGKVDIRHMNVDNPFGMDPEDPAGQDDILVAEPVLHLEVDQPAHVLLRSTDVLHNFTVPQFRVKMDLVPGMVTYQWFTPTVPGTYEVLCEEHCGVGHFAMRSKVVVDSAEDYEAWLATQPTFADTQARPVGNVAAGQATYGVCSACHGADGLGNEALGSPRLAGMPGWYIRRQINNWNAGIRGTAEGDTFGQQMAPMARTLVAPAALENVIAYIDTLEFTKATPSIDTGDAERGAMLYQSCAVCHGKEGEGRWNTNAPPLAGMDDWYLKRQLENFQSRIRGGHADDIYGDQMYLLAGSLSDDAAIDDVIAYINTL